MADKDVKTTEDEKTEEDNKDVIDIEALKADILKSVTENAKAEAKKILKIAQQNADDIIKKAGVAAEQINSVQSNPKAPEKVEMVPIKLFKDGDRYKDDVPVTLNGKLYLIQRGKVVMVPRGVKEILDTQERQDIDAALYREKKSEEYAATL